MTIIMALTAPPNAKANRLYHASTLIPTLPSSEVGAMLVDSRGLLWIGTTDGLLNYDGYTLHPTLTGKEARSLMHSSHILSLAETDRQTLWIGTYDGLLRMNLRTGKLRRYELPKKSQQIIYTLFASSNGTLYVGTDDGLSIYQAESDTFQHYYDRNTVATFANGQRDTIWGYSVKSICELPDGDLLLGTWSSGLLRFDPNKRTFHAYNRLSNMNSAHSIAVDKQGRVWIGSWDDGILRLAYADDYALTTLQRMDPPKGDFGAVYALQIHPDQQSAWACTNGGIRVVDMGNDNITDLEWMDGKHVSMARRIASSRQGLFFVATQQGLVLRISPQRLKFRFFSDNRLSSIYSIFTEDGNRLLVGNGNQGIAQIDIRTGTVLYNNQVPGMEVLGRNGYGLKVGNIISRKDDELWMAARDMHILKAPRGGEMQVIGTKLLDCLADNVEYIYEDHRKRLWIGMRQNVSVVWPDGRCQYLDTMTESLGINGYLIVNHIMQDSGGRIWVSTKNGGIVSIEDARGGKSSGSASTPFRYKHFPEPSNITACFEDSHHRLWAISPTDGLLLHGQRTERFEAVNERLRLPESKICAIIEDSYGCLWLSTENSLIRMSLNDQLRGNMTTFTTDDGLPPTSFLPNASFRHGNMLYFGRTGGVVQIDASQNRIGTGITGNGKLSGNPSTSPLVITNFLIDGTSIDKIDTTLASSICDSQPAFARKLSLPPSVRRLTIEMALLNYTSTAATRYAYRLEGYHDEWQHLPAGQHSITFDRLESGTYQLHIKATDSYGISSALTYPLTIKVLPPVYRTWWAYIIYIGILLALGRFVYNYLQMLREAEASRRFTAITRSIDISTHPQDQAQTGITDAAAQKNAEFLHKVSQLVMSHLDDSEYNRDHLAEDLGMSLSTLYNRLREVTGLSIQTFIQNVRLNAAADILRQEPDIRISELAYRVGFNTPKYFSQCFKKEFGMLPGEYIKRQ